MNRKSMFRHAMLSGVITCIFRLKASLEIEEISEKILCTKMDQRWLPGIYRLPKIDYW